MGVAFMMELCESALQKGLGEDGKLEFYLSEEFEPCLGV